jgi:predicted 2-oxoglutarate/Fe(II)-dependent dioxygenase YbiX
MIYEIPNFLDNETCDMLIDYFKNSNQRSEWQEDNFFRGRTLCPYEITDNVIQKRMEVFKSKTLQEVSRLFHEKYVFLEFWDIVHWPEGIKMESHSDNTYPDKTPSNCFQRDYSSICYLNHDYKGGNTFFVYENKTCIPQKGKIIFYPSGLQFTHGVSKVTEGNRYTLASWYSNDERYILTSNSYQF